MNRPKRTVLGNEKLRQAIDDAIRTHGPMTARALSGHLLEECGWDLSANEISMFVRTRAKSIIKAERVSVDFLGRHSTVYRHGPVMGSSSGFGSVVEELRAALPEER